MNKINLFNGDALVGLDNLIKKGIKVDLIITDPPYRITSRGNSGNTGGMLKTSKDGKIFKHNDIKPEQYARKFYDLLKEGTHCYIMTNAKNLQAILNAFTNAGFKFVKHLVWVKPNKIMGRWYMTQNELILMFRKGKARPINNAGTSDVIFSPDFKKDKVNKKNLHDTQKPISVMETLIINSSDPNEIVCDPFAGIFTTGIASVKNNRKCILMEIDPIYFNIGKELIENRKDK